jgi:hypothetical protein
MYRTPFSQNDRLLIMTLDSFPALKCQDASRWSFLAEGFDSMIFSYIGPPHPALAGHVLRLFKSQNDGFRRGGLPPPSDFTAHVVLHQRFVRSLVAPHLPAIDAGIPAAVDLPFVADLGSLAQPRRSHKRIRESSLCLTSPVGLVHRNHILPNAIVVEIKPKWGFLPDCPLVQTPVKRSVSKFQLMQRLKLKKGEISSLSAYDPIDLFSKCPEKVERALSALIQNPQGNLKVFRDCGASILEPDEIPALVQHFVSESSALCRTMDQLLALQKLDFWDIECIPPILEKSGHPNWEALLDDQTVVDGVHKLLSEKFTIPNTADAARELIDSMDEAVSRVHIAAFLISQSAKDCSLMIVFPAAISDPPECFAIDFDLKKTELLISNYLAADRKVVDAYLEWKAAR